MLVSSKTFKIFLIILIFQCVRADYFSSVVKLKDLINAEKHLVNNFENYLDRVHEKNNKLKKYLHEFTLEVQDSTKNAISSYDQALQHFKSIKRLIIDWQDLEYFVFNPVEAKEYAQNLSKLQDTGFVSPNIEDLHGAAKGLARLQSVYSLDTEDVANGVLWRNQSSPDLTASECFYIGRSLYEAKEMNYAIKWLIEADKRQTTTTLSFSVSQVTPQHILKYLAAAFYGSGNWVMAHKTNEELLALSPKNKHALKNRALYEQAKIDARRGRLQSDVSSTTLKQAAAHEIYEKVCRMELVQTASEQRELRCRYVSNNVPFCLIAPFKMEELNIDPYVAFYHEAIYESEIEYILSVSEHKVERSTVGVQTMPLVTDLRTSQNAWLKIEENGFLSAFVLRLEDITGLTMDTGEDFQVANYGIGGHYGPHHDFFENGTFFGAIGNRILTAMAYINHVELGGGTAFPYLRLTVPPIRRSLVIWYNMHESLELDYRTKHAGCPVLKGSKWIVNEWFHEGGQEFLKPCSLTQQGYKSLKYREF